jgi:hypothetical protein
MAVPGQLMPCGVTIIRKVDRYIRAISRRPCLLLITLRLPSIGAEEGRHMFYDQDKARAARLLGLDIVDWSLLLSAIGLAALAVVLA